MAEPRRREARREVCLRPEARKNGNSSESFARFGDALRSGTGTTSLRVDALRSRTGTTSFRQYESNSLLLITDNISRVFNEL
nr:hypothetical protein Itr_chr12CG04720 [Ipomoea trifida]